MRIISFLMLAFLGISSLLAQPKIYDQFFMNPYLYNPAYVGVEGRPVAFAMYKKQWSNVSGAPQLGHVSFHQPLPGGIAIGAAIWNDQQGVLSTTAGKVSVGYLMNFDRTHYLRFGLSLGGGSRSIQAAEFDGAGDPAFAGFQDSSFELLGDFGLTYHFGHFNAGISLPQLITSDIVSESGLSELNVNPQDNILLKANYKGHISNQLVFEPHVIYRYSKYLPNQYEATGIFHIKHTLWMGASYRENAGVIALGGFKIGGNHRRSAREKKEKISPNELVVGFAYDLGTANLSDLLGPTFEIHLGLRLGPAGLHSWNTPRRPIVSGPIKDSTDVPPLDTLQVDPDSSKFIPPTDTGIKWIYESDNQKDTVNSDGTIVKVHILRHTLKDGSKQTVRALPPPQYDGIPWELANPNEHSLQERDNNGMEQVGVIWYRILPDGTRQEEVKWENISSPQRPDIVDIPLDTAKIKTDTIEKVGPDDIPTGPTEVKKGDNLLELGTGIYLVAAQFESFDAAENFSDQAFNKGYRNVRVGYVSARERYHVVLDSYSSVAEAEQQKTIIGASSDWKLWVLTVSD